MKEHSWKHTLYLVQLMPCQTPMRRGHQGNGLSSGNALHSVPRVQKSKDLMPQLLSAVLEGYQKRLCLVFTGPKPSCTLCFTDLTYSYYPHFYGAFMKVFLLSVFKPSIL